MALKKGDRQVTIAVIGGGPRALGALEALYLRSRDSRVAFDVTLFEPLQHPGHGPNFDPVQGDICLLNVPQRELALGEPLSDRLDALPYAGWRGDDMDPEVYPPRSLLGEYLKYRFASLSRQCDSRFSLRHEPRRAITLSVEGDGFRIAGDDGLSGTFAEILLTIGQAGTRPDPQLARWQSHAHGKQPELLHAYPESRLRHAARNWAGRTVAIRGLGLSTLDVLRLLTIGQGGKFVAGQYVASGREPELILPFSLDGQPPFPKPANRQIDRRFDPEPAETREFRKRLGAALGGDPESCLKTVCDALHAPVLRIAGLFNKAVTGEEIEGWLETERRQAGAQETAPARRTLVSGIGMARGRLPPSIGYITGQIWRKWQNDLRQLYNPAKIDADIATALCEFDEGMKRYSYGPPVASCEQLKALVDAGLVDLQAVADPDIELCGEGWRLVTHARQAVATVMIDAVLPSPALEHSSEPILASLAGDGRIVAIADGLGTKTAPDSQLVQTDGSLFRGVSMLGRMAIGSVIAVDSIHDCFGASAGRWADGVVARHN